MLRCRCPISSVEFQVIVLFLLGQSLLRFGSEAVAQETISPSPSSSPLTPKPFQFRNISFVLNGPNCECDTPLLFEQLLENTVHWFENRTQNRHGSVFENCRFQTIVYRTCTDQQYVSLQTNGNGTGGDRSDFLIEPLIFEPELLLKALKAFLVRLRWTNDLYVVCDDLSFRDILMTATDRRSSVFFCISELFSFRNLLRLNVTLTIPATSPLILIGSWKQLTIAANYLNSNFRSITERLLYLSIDGFPIHQQIANDSYYVETTAIEANNPKNIFNAVFLQIIHSLLTKLSGDSTADLPYSEIVRKFELNGTSNDRFLFHLMRNGAKLLAFDLIESRVRTRPNVTFESEKFAANAVLVLPAYCVSMRPDRVWIWIVLTSGFLGFSISLLIVAYMLKKICERIIFEGSPLLSLLLLIGVGLMYLAVVPFALECPLCCGWKVAAVAFARHFVLALMFARLVLLKSISNADISLHVSGFSLSVLIVFETALSIVLVAFSVVVFCPDRIQDAYRIQIVYDSILLTGVFLLAPFVYTCRRNYNESFYFAICSILLVLNRLATVFVFARHHYRSDWIDPILAYGLLSDATIILGVVFVPRTYLINVAEVKEIILASTLSQSHSKLPIRTSNSFETSYAVASATNHNNSTDF